MQTLEPTPIQDLALPSIAAGSPMDGDAGRRKRDFARVIGKVKFFDTDKGHGFLYFGDGSGDAFMPADILGSHGLTTLLPDTTVAGRIENYQDGRRKVHSIWAIDESTVPASAKGRRCGPVVPSRAPGLDPTHPRTSRMRVKIFNPIQGWGFLEEPEHPDVFVHISVVKAAGLQEIVKGESVEVDVAWNDKGPCALAIRTFEP